jgi:predicted DNA-binding transcriptional regulator YafY
VARNDQVMRLLQLVRLLESSRGLTLKQLADGPPDDFPKHLRTIRRDLIALESLFAAAQLKLRQRVLHGGVDVAVFPGVAAAAQADRVDEF